MTSTYTGGSGFDPTSITIDNSGETAYVSDGSGVDVSTLSSGAYAASVLDDLDLAHGRHLDDVGR